MGANTGCPQKILPLRVCFGKGWACCMFGPGFESDWIRIRIRTLTRGVECQNLYGGILVDTPGPVAGSYTVSLSSLVHTSPKSAMTHVLIF